MDHPEKNTIADGMTDSREKIRSDETWDNKESVISS
jgi:hypothetical protein